MTGRRKISIRKVLQVFLTLVVTSACVIAITSASKMEDRKKLKGIAIHFKNDKKYHFIQEQEIMDLAIKNTHTDTAHTPISRLDTRAMERLIMADQWVAFAQVYVDNERVLHMWVTQRIPVVRIFQQNGCSFYLDTTLSIMSLSPNSIYNTTVVTNVPELKNDSVSWALRKDIVTLARQLQADTFWNAQVSQVVVDSPGMFELVPTLGDQRILFGSVTAAKDKLHNLFVFYKDVLNRIGWDKYQTLDVRFKDQVVASPSLPYHGPVDKGIDTMNWIDGIEKPQAAKDTKDSAQAASQKASGVAVKPVVPEKKVDKPVATAASKPVTKPVDKPVSNKNDKPVSNKGDKLASKPVEGPAGKQSEKPLSKPVDKAAASKSDKLASKPVEKPVGNKGDKPVIKPVDKSVSNKGDKLASKAVDKSVSNKGDKPASKPVDKSASDKGGKLASKPVEKPIGKQSEKPANNNGDKLAGKPVGKTVSKPSEKPASKPVDKSVSNKGDKLASKPLDKAAGKQIDKPVNKPLATPANKPGDKQANKQGDKPVSGQVKGNTTDDKKQQVPKYIYPEKKN